MTPSTDDIILKSEQIAAISRRVDWLEKQLQTRTRDFYLFSALRIASIGAEADTPLDLLLALEGGIVRRIVHLRGEMAFLARNLAMELTNAASESDSEFEFESPAEASD